MQTTFEPGDRVQAERRKKSRIKKGTIVRIDTETGRAFVRWSDRMGWMGLKYLRLEGQEKESPRRERQRRQF